MVGAIIFPSPITPKISLLISWTCKKTRSANLKGTIPVPVPVPAENTGTGTGTNNDGTNINGKKHSHQA